MSNDEQSRPEPGLEAFDVVDGVGMFRPAGTVHWRQAVALVARGIAHARAMGIGRLLIVVTRLDGFKPPGIAARLQMVREWAEAADGQVTIAVVARHALIDPERVGVVAASTLGAKANVFESEAEALAWLRAH